MLDLQAMLTGSDSAVLLYRINYLVNRSRAALGFYCYVI